MQTYMRSMIRSTQSAGTYALRSHALAAALRGQDVWHRVYAPYESVSRRWGSCLPLSRRAGVRWVHAVRAAVPTTALCYVRVVTAEQRIAPRSS
jgi:hypothetical protein